MAVIGIPGGSRRPRHKRGGSRKIDVSMTEGVMSLLPLCQCLFEYGQGSPTWSSALDGSPRF